MNKRLTEKQRTAMEARYKLLRTAAMDAGKISGIVDKAKDNSDIEGTVESIMKAMDAETDAGKYAKASANTKNRVARLLKAALDEMNPDAGENPEEEAKDFQDPALHMVEDLEHEVQTMDDHRLVKEIQQLEEHMKEDLGKMHEDAPTHNESDNAAPVMHEEKHELSSEARLALLMSLPAAKRIAKAAQLRALANTLDKETKEVSQNNQMVEQPGEPELAHDYENEEMGSMKDVKAANLKKTVKQILAAMSEEEAKKALDSVEDDDKNKSEEMEDKDKGADKRAHASSVINLALRHLYASLEDLEEAREEKEDKDDDKEDDKKDLDESEGGKPNWLQNKQVEKEVEEGKESKEEAEDDKEPTMDEKKAILRARLASLKRTATVDGRSMPVPKEVPKPEDASKNNTFGKGDAPVQYSTTSGAEGLNHLQTVVPKPVKQDLITNDKNGEPKSLYMSNQPGMGDGQISEKENDSTAKEKRVLRDGQWGIQKSTPSAGAGSMELGEGTHQKEVSWEKAKEDADQTPHNDRMRGEASLNEVIKVRTARAAKLASHMANLGFISTEEQLTQKIAELASLDDAGFELVASFTPKSAPAATTRGRYAAEDDKEWDDHDEEHDDEDDDKEDKNHNGVPDDEEFGREAGLVRRASQNSRSASKTSKMVRQASSESRGLRTPLLSGTEDIVSHRASTISRGGDGLANKLASLGWDDPKTQARKAKASLDDIFGEDIR